MEWKESARLVLRTLKVRDGEKLPPLYLVRRSVDLSLMGRDGKPMTSCVVEADPQLQGEREAAAAAKAKAKAEAQATTTDLDVLRAIVKHPDITNAKEIRALAALRYPDALDALTRLARRQFVIPGKRGEPYQVTDLGHAELAKRAPKK